MFLLNYIALTNKEQISGTFLTYTQQHSLIKKTVVLYRHDGMTCYSTSIAECRYDSLLDLALELVSGGLDGHARAVKPEWEQGVFALETLVLHHELTLQRCDGH